MVVRPLIQRELLRECRHGTHFLYRAAFVTALGLVVLWRVMQIGSGGTAYQLAQVVMAKHGAWLFIAWAIVQFVGVVAFSTFRAAEIASERRAKSLELLRATSLSDGGVTLGWFLSVTGRALTIMFLSLPVLFICRSLGGFTLAQVCVVVLITILAAATAAALTLALGALSNSAGGVVIASILAQFLALIAVGAMDRAGIWSFSIEWASPALLLIKTAKSSRLVPWEIRAFAASHAVATGLALIAAFRLLRRPTVSLGRPLKQLLKRTDNFFYRVSRGTVLWSGKLGPCRGNPVLWRERAVSVLGSLDHIIRLGYWMLLLVLVCACVAAAFLGGRGAIAVLSAGLLAIPVVLIALVTIVPAATAFVRERQEKTLHLLAATPLSPTQIVMGKYRFALRPLWIPLGLITLALALWLVFEIGTWGRPLRVLRYFAPALLLPLIAAEILYVCLGADSTAKAVMAGAAVLAGAVMMFFGGSEVFRDVARTARHAGGLSVPMILISSFLAMAAAAAAQRFVIARNAFVLGAVSLLPFVVVSGSKGPDPLFLVYVGALPVFAVVTLLCLGAVATALARRPTVARNAFILTGVAVVAAIVLSASGGIGSLLRSRVAVHWGLGLSAGFCFVATYRAMRYAGGGILNRAALAILAHALLFAIPIMLRVEGLLPFLALGAPAGVLWLCVKQADELMGRNG